MVPGAWFAGDGKKLDYGQMIIDYYILLWNDNHIFYTRKKTSFIIFNQQVSKLYISLGHKIYQ